MQHDHVLQKLNFNLLTPRAGGGGVVGKVFSTMLLHSRLHLIWYAIQPCSEKSEFKPFYSQGRGGGRGIIVAIHVAAPVIHFNLICNMIMF